MGRLTRLDVIRPGSTSRHRPGFHFIVEYHGIRVLLADGIGIKACYQEQIFQAFERLHIQEEYEGSGIGLAIVAKAARKLGGSVRVESKPGEGSTFFVTLPRTTKES